MNIQDNIKIFNNKYNELIVKPIHIKSNELEEFLNNGNDIITQNIENELKQDILSKLIIIFPDNASLYYLMGCILKEKSEHLALLWFRICYDKSPTHYDNITELSLFYMKNGMIDNFINMDKNGIFDKMIDDPVVNPIFHKIYANIYIQMNNYKNVIKCILKSIKQTVSIPSKTAEEKRAKWWDYHHIGFSYIVTSQPEKAVQYTNKATDLANKFNLNLSERLLSFQNLLAFHDFTYNDLNKTFDRYLEINDYLPNNYDIFSFDNRIANVKNNKTIKIGYVSSDYCHHPVANFITPILEQHNKNRFDITLFINMISITPEFTKFMKDYNINYFIINDMSDIKVAELVYDNNIDILVDLNGHTIKNRLGVFALNPAPIQMTYLGYPNTTGLKSIRYRITDFVADNIDTKQPYTEELLRLPKCFLIFKHMHQDKPTKPRATIPDTIILGALNKEKKNNDNVFDSWKQILRDCPNTKLLIKLETFDNNAERLSFYKKKLEVDASRLIIINKLSNYDYDNLFTKIDIVLDTFPYSGTTTTCDSLYNSVPVVTFSNPDYHCHNVSASILINSDLNDLVATSKESYIDKVKYLVNNPEKIDEYKRTINKKFMNCMNPSEFIKPYEGIMEYVYSKFYETNYTDRKDK